MIRSITYFTVGSLLVALFVGCGVQDEQADVPSDGAIAQRPVDSSQAAIDPAALPEDPSRMAWEPPAEMSPPEPMQAVPDPVSAAPVADPTSSPDAAVRYSLDPTTPRDPAASPDLLAPVDPAVERPDYGAAQPDSIAPYEPLRGSESPRIGDIPFDVQRRAVRERMEPIQAQEVTQMPLNSAQTSETMTIDRPQAVTARVQAPQAAGTSPRLRSSASPSAPSTSSSLLRTPATTLPSTQLPNTRYSPVETPAAEPFAAESPAMRSLAAEPMPEPAAEPATAEPPAMRMLMSNPLPRAAASESAVPAEESMPVEESMLGGGEESVEEALRKESTPLEESLAATPEETTLESEAPEQSADATAAAEAETDEDFETVQVFYATDRQSLGEASSDQLAFVTWGIATLMTVGLGLILAAVGYGRRRSRAMQIAAMCSAGGAAVLGLLTAIAAFQDFTAEKLPETTKIAYGNQRGEVEYGTCEVSIPKNHAVGQLEAPSVLKLDFRENPERHVMLLGVEPLDGEKFFSQVREKVGTSHEQRAFVFVHGYNVTFDDAARRTAQMTYDLKYDGAPIFYSWPSQGGLFQYTIDENNVAWTVPHLKQFLIDVAERSGAKQIHLIAHSMGNRALTSALKELAYIPEIERPKFREVILTAPDVDAEIFKRDIVPAIVKTTDRVTLYASSNDKALASSKQVHGSPRAGESGENLVVVPGIDTIDVSAIDTSLFGLNHSYYGSNDTVLADLFTLLHEAKPPAQRHWLHARMADALPYWEFQRK